MPITRLRFLRLPVLTALAAAAVGAGCVREVLSGEDPQRKPGRLTGDARTDELVVRIPWMETPPPRLLLEGKLARFETVYSRSPDGRMRFTLRTQDGASAVVDVRTRRLKDDSMEFTYEVRSLPPRFGADTAIEVREAGIKPAIDLAVNGAPVRMAPGTEVAVVQLSRDASTRIVAVPRTPPGAAPAPSAKP